MSDNSYCVQTITEHPKSRAQIPALLFFQRLGAGGGSSAHARIRFVSTSTVVTADVT